MSCQELIPTQLSPGRRPRSRSARQQQQSPPSSSVEATTLVALSSSNEEASQAPVAQGTLRALSNMNLGRVIGGQETKAALAGDVTFEKACPRACLGPWGIAGSRRVT